MNLVLIGMRGSGKTTVAKLLAKRLHKNVYDLDFLLVNKVGMSIPEIVKKYTWEYFRDREAEIIEEVTQVSNAVIATGGGFVLRNKNIAKLRKNGIFIFLHISIEEAMKRIGDDHSRPALTNNKSRKEEWNEVYKTRKILYEQTADIVIQTDHKTQDQVVKEIVEQI